MVCGAAELNRDTSDTTCPRRPVFHHLSQPFPAFSQAQHHSGKGQPGGSSHGCRGAQIKMEAVGGWLGGSLGFMPHASIFPCNSTPEASKLVPLSACIDTFAEAEELKVRELGSHSMFDDRGLEWIRCSDTPE